MGNIKDLRGKRFGRLTVISENGRDKIQNVLWLCKCDCGNEITVRGSMLNRGTTKSCGCMRKEVLSDLKTIHGNRRTRIYRIWCDMKTRCSNQDSNNYEKYGARGIYVCKEWIEDFTNFYDWAMANGYRDDLTLDRIDNDKGYCPENCRWATPIEQANNKRNNRLVEYNGETHTIAEWSRIVGINAHTLRSRIESGIFGEELFDKKDRRCK